MACMHTYTSIKRIKNKKKELGDNVKTLSALKKKKITEGIS